MATYKYLTLIFINLLFLCDFSSAQEQLVPLHSNKQQALSVNNLLNNERSAAIYPAKIHYILDTLNLPFVDDFSTNKSQIYHYPAFPSGNVSDYNVYSYEISSASNTALNGHPATINYSRNRQYDSTWVGTGLAWQRLVADSFTISFYSFPKVYPLSPFIADSSFTAWRGGLRQDSGTAVLVPNIDASVISLALSVDSIKVVKISGSGFYGNWMDTRQHVFINNTFPINQPTIGVATFDGLNDRGTPHDSMPMSTGRADYLTSKPINLNYTSPKYLSFLWQRQGLGDMPEFSDSLMLQFRTPQTNWQIIWSKTGGVGDTIFTQKTIVIDSIFLKNGFQFRFINRATLSGANDHWNIDYVRVVANANDTIINDLAFVTSPTSFLKKYQAVPYLHYTSDLMSDTVINYINNLSPANLGQNTNFDYRVTDFFGQNQIDAISIANFNFAASEVNNCNFCESALNPLRVTSNHPKLIFTTMSACTEYRIKQWLTPLSLTTLKENDTIQFIQHFNDYFAYDDGTAEAGYLLTTPGASMALPFDLNVADNMLGMRIFFDPINEDFSELNFYIRVWNDTTVTLNGNPFKRPGHVLYEYGPFKPKYTNEFDKSAFAEYLFTQNTPLPIGKFYAGIYKESDLGLNIGFDRNNNNQRSMFFTPTIGVWGNTQFEGTYMMRPLFGSCPNGVPSIIEEVKLNDFQLFPNPTNGSITIKSDSNQPYSNITITDLTGRKLYNVQNTSNTNLIDVSELNNGIYLVNIMQQNGESVCLKFIKN